MDQSTYSNFELIVRNTDLDGDVHGVCLRNDVPDSENNQQQGWKGLKVIGPDVLTA
jgi:hypothetical protein